MVDTIDSKSIFQYENNGSSPLISIKKNMRFYLKEIKYFVIFNIVNFFSYGFIIIYFIKEILFILSFSVGKKFPYATLVFYTTNGNEFLEIIYISIIFFSGLFFSLNMIYLLYLYILPGIFLFEKKKLSIYIYLLIYLGLVIFLFNFFLISPYLWKFLISFQILENTEILNLKIFPKFNEYFFFFIKTFGFCVIIGFLCIGLIIYFIFLKNTNFFFLKKRKYIYIYVIVIFSCFVITDLLTQIVISIIILVFYEIISFLLIFFFFLKDSGNIL